MKLYGAHKFSKICLKPNPQNKFFCKLTQTNQISLFIIIFIQSHQSLYRKVGTAVVSVQTHRKHVTHFSAEISFPLCSQSGEMFCCLCKTHKYTFSINSNDVFFFLYSATKITTCNNKKIIEQIAHFQTCYITTSRFKSLFSIFIFLQI